MQNLIALFDQFYIIAAIYIFNFYLSIFYIFNSVVCCNA